ncbi:MAG TPA: hypothetical protein VJR30_06840, partial [Bradyrhizobium sp.]|nr:hypothetical protein [Bradyrhizobium sp.]
MTKIMLAVLTIVLCSAAQPRQAFAAECPRWKSSTGPTGITLTVCLDGKYSTCVRDSRRLGYPEAQTQSYCARLR